MNEKGGRVRVLYYGVRDPSYPRNERIRSFLEKEIGATITINRAIVGGGRVRRYFSQLRATIQLPRNFDVVILSEFSLNFFIFSWLAAKRSRASHIVDFFVGLHETEVGDAGTTRPLSIRAAVLAGIDRGAILSSDACLTDTPLRAKRFAALAGFRRPFLSLPVGAPAWALQGPSTQQGDGSKISVLYYGSYLALHGLNAFIQAIAALGDPRLAVTLIGDGPLRPEIEAGVERLGLRATVTFVDPMSTHDLAGYITNSDVIVGIFGTSDKASEVIANKVWQGLYMGKTVLTRSTPALDEIADIANGSLVLVESGSTADIATGLRAILISKPISRENGQATGIELEKYVDGKFHEAFRAAPLSEIFSPSPTTQELPRHSKDRQDRRSVL